MISSALHNYSTQCNQIIRNKASTIQQIVQQCGSNCDKKIWTNLPYVVHLFIGQAARHLPIGTYT